MITIDAISQHLAFGFTPMEQNSQNLHTILLNSHKSRHSFHCKSWICQRQDVFPPWNADFDWL